MEHKKYVAKLFIVLVLASVCLGTLTAFANPVNDECPRAVPEPVINKKNYPQTVFTLSQDSSSAIESTNLENGDALTITHAGCDYYTLIFRFETTKYAADTTNLKYWYGAAAKLLTPMISAIDAPIDIKRGIMYLGYKTGESEKDLQLNEEIEFGDENLRELVYIYRIEKLKDNKYSVEIVFSTGPL